MFLTWSSDIKGKVGVANKQKSQCILERRESTLNDELNLVSGFVDVQLQ